MKLEHVGVDGLEGLIGGCAKADHKIGVVTFSSEMKINVAHLKF
jgi:hypothetical protein